MIKYILWCTLYLGTVYVHLENNDWIYTLLYTFLGTVYVHLENNVAKVIILILVAVKTQFFEIRFEPPSVYVECEIMDGSQADDGLPWTSWNVNTGSHYLRYVSVVGAPTLLHGTQGSPFIIVLTLN